VGKPTVYTVWIGGNLLMKIKQCKGLCQRRVGVAVCLQTLEPNMATPGLTKVFGRTLGSWWQNLP